MPKYTILLNEMVFMKAITTYIEFIPIQLIFKTLTQDFRWQVGILGIKFKNPAPPCLILERPPGTAVSLPSSEPDLLSAPRGHLRLLSCVTSLPRVVPSIIPALPPNQPPLPCIPSWVLMSNCLLTGLEDFLDLYCWSVLLTVSSLWYQSREDRACELSILFKDAATFF